jgi:hypothetical protein
MKAQSTEARIFVRAKDEAGAAYICRMNAIEILARREQKNSSIALIENL